MEQELYCKARALCLVHTQSLESKRETLNFLFESFRTCLELKSIKTSLKFPQGSNNERNIVISFAPRNFLQFDFFQSRKNNDEDVVERHFPTLTHLLEEKMNTLKLVDFCLIFLLHTARILVAVSMLQTRFWSIFF